MLTSIHIVSNVAQRNFVRLRAACLLQHDKADGII